MSDQLRITNYELRITNNFWSQVRAIIWKDLALERRTKQSVSAMFVFALASAITFGFVEAENLDATEQVAVGLFWVIVWLAGTLGLNRSFSAETESHALDAILIAPVERSALYFGKLISLTISLAITEAMLIPLFTILFHRPFYRPMVVLILLLGTIGYVAAGVFVATMAVQTRSSYVLIPILILPITFPLIMAASAVSAEYISITPRWSDIQTPFILVLIFDILMLSAGFLAYNYVVEE